MGKQQNKGASAPQQQNGKPQQQQAKAAPQQQKPAAKPQQQQGKKQPKQPEPESEEEDEDELDGGEDDDEEEGEDEDEDGEDDEDEYSDMMEESLEDLGEPLGFWGAKITPDEPAIVCSGDMRVLRIGTAALAHDAKPGTRASLVVCVPKPEHELEAMAEDEEDPEAEEPFNEFVVCTLLADSRPDASFELFFTGTERGLLKVVSSDPEARVDVTGVVTYLEIPKGDDEDEELEDGEYDDEEDEEADGFYDEDGEVLEGTQAFDDEEDDEDEDSEAAADAHGPAAVHARDAARAAAAAKKNKAKPAAAKKGGKAGALPSIISELMADDDDEDEDEDEDSDEEEEADLLTEQGAEKARQKLKGRIEQLDAESPKVKPAQAPKSPQQKPAAAAAPTPKRKANAPAEVQTPAAKKAKTAATPAAATTPAAPKTPAGAAGQFKCGHCERSFGLEAALKQHTSTKHAGATPAKKA